jgi:hypothetical protein
LHTIKEAYNIIIFINKKFHGKYATKTAKEQQIKGLRFGL